MMSRMNPIAEDTTKSLRETWDDFFEDWGEGIMKGVAIAQEVMGSISQLASSVAQKETSELENEKAKQQELHDADYERQLARIENGVMDEEAKQLAIEELNATFASKKLIMDEKIAAKEKAMKIKQAKREKAMAIANAIINGIAAVVKVSANIPLAIAVGALNLANIATMAATPIPAFAEGGIISGPTVGLMGEYPGAGTGNPEVVAPLKKLQNMMGGGDNKNVQISGRLSGNDIYLANSKQSIDRLRFV